MRKSSSWTEVAECPEASSYDVLKQDTDLLLMEFVCRRQTRMLEPLRVPTNAFWNSLSREWVNHPSSNAKSCTISSAEEITRQSALTFRVLLRRTSQEIRKRQKSTRSKCSSIHICSVKITRAVLRFRQFWVQGIQNKCPTDPGKVTSTVELSTKDWSKVEIIDSITGQLRTFYHPNNQNDSDKFLLM